MKYISIYIKKYDIKNHKITNTKIIIYDNDTCSTLSTNKAIR